MALVSSASKDSGSVYCRKQKSLGLRCSNFLSLYNREGVETIGLDDAAKQLASPVPVLRPRCLQLSTLGLFGGSSSPTTMSRALHPRLIRLSDLGALIGLLLATV